MRPFAVPPMGGDDTSLFKVVKPPLAPLARGVVPAMPDWQTESAKVSPPLSNGRKPTRVKLASDRLKEGVGCPQQVYQVVAHSWYLSKWVLIG
jgi:hypothetical protein